RHVEHPADAGLGTLDDLVKPFAAVAHFHHALAGTMVVQQLGLSTLQNGYGKHRRSRAEVIYTIHGKNLPQFSARLHKKAKSQNSDCKSASDALSGLAFHEGALRPSALHLPPCSGFVMQSSSCRTSVSYVARALCAAPIYNVAR